MRWAAVAVGGVVLLTIVAVLVGVLTEPRYGYPWEGRRSEEPCTPSVRTAATELLGAEAEVEQLTNDNGPTCRIVGTSVRVDLGVLIGDAAERLPPGQDVSGVGDAARLTTGLDIGVLTAIEGGVGVEVIVVGDDFDLELASAFARAALEEGRPGGSG